MARHDELVYGLYEKEQHSCAVEFYCYDSESLKSTGVEFKHCIILSFFVVVEHLQLLFKMFLFESEASYC